MAGILRFLIVSAAACGALGQLAAAPLSFDVTSTKKRFDVSTSATEDKKFSKEHWGYTITIENKSFQLIQDLAVEYRQYKFDDVRNGGGTLKGVPGSTKIPSLGNGAKFKFDTDPVELDKEELKAGWHYTNKSNKEKVADALQGYWLRILKDGQVVFEFQYPPELTKKVKWE
jgi:ABC-type glycerol-3-phosphate transport system substrate-binding protein